HSLTAIATDNAQLSTTSASITVSVTAAPSGGTSAVFAGLDTTTQGDWQNQYGAQGYSIVGDATSLPGSMTITTSGAGTYVWNASTSELRALRRAVQPGRLAATWVGATQFD